MIVREAGRRRYECPGKRHPVRRKPKQAILEETLRVLKDKFHRTPEELRESDKQLRVDGRIVTPMESINVIDADPSDDRIRARLRRMQTSS